MDKAFYNAEHDLGIIGNGSAIVSFKEVSSKPLDTPVLKDFDGRKFSYWGPDNLFPQGVIADYRKVTEVASAIQLLSNSMVNGGLVYGTTKIDDAGNEKFIRGWDPAAEDWLRKTAIARYLREASWEYYTFWNVFPRLRASNDRSGIASIDVQETAFSRLGKQNEKDGSIDTLFVCANWDRVQDTGDKTVISYDLIDPYFDAAGQFLKNKKLREFIYPLAGSDSGYTYYATAPWNSVRESGWLDVVKAIPAFKKALMKFQYTLKYHFEITKTYLYFLYPNYDSMPDAEKITVKNEVLDMLDKKFKGADEAGKNILSLADTSPSTGEMISGLKVSAVDDKIKDGIYIEDSQEGALHVYNAFGIDQTIANSLPGRNLGSSGSDKRVAYNIHIANRKPEQDIILEPVDFCFEVNGFKKKFQKDGIFTMMLKTYWLATLDQGKQPIPEPQQQAK